MTQGATISVEHGKLLVPDNPIIPFIEGDGTGPDIWRASVRVFDAAVARAYGGRRTIAWKEVLAGTIDRDGDLPVNPDGGLKSFGHPVGASGLRMMFEAWLQLRGEAPPERRIATVDDRSLALTHNLGGYPGEMVSFVGIVGNELG